MLFNINFCENYNMNNLGHICTRMYVCSKIFIYVYVIINIWKKGQCVWGKVSSVVEFSSNQC